MSQTPAGGEPAPVRTISADHLQLVLVAAKMRKHNAGRTCQLCVLTEHPTISLECREARRRSASTVDAVRRHGISQARVQPMHRGGIGRLFERVRLHHGLKEVRTTWGAGIRALRAEPQFVLNGGAR